MHVEVSRASRQLPWKPAGNGAVCLALFRFFFGTKARLQTSLYPSSAGDRSSRLNATRKLCDLWIVLTRFHCLARGVWLYGPVGVGAPVLETTRCAFVAESRLILPIQLPKSLNKMLKLLIG